ncbi:rRNA biogenesis protein rrp5 [Neolecta irregularis DAH-3]|uniref:rRNA biogenesis protein rrp5 n=1 Tax=Neolecta irregularis (strain DAH-3) TaxID=1198029 RepID=A0A1U7LW81_NEOID|nr:rRNA biogenesis protein rrp5 [Neolecta irregularis DAH-3]|eukprot:OLL26878.1 rRNA biogenesis protein rrp5 [Neolecta irregularis DAH-3]
MGIPKRKIKPLDVEREIKKISRASGVSMEQPEKRRKTEKAVESGLLLHNDDADFPRGGGSTLTPLEYKEAVNEGIRDLLFENEKGTNDSGSKKRKRSKKDNDSKQLNQEIKEGPKIEGLSYKRVVQGSQILGRISQINSLEMVVSLPNNLSAFIPITAISPFLTKKIETSAENETSDSEEIDIPPLVDMFTVGQWVRGAVTSCETDKNKKRITMSIEPSAANFGLSTENLVPGIAIMASVKSIEDHGIVCDVNIEKTSGFVKRKEFGHFKHDDFKEGQTMLVYLKSVSNRILQLSVNPPASAVTEAPSIDTFSPGTLAQVLITDVTSKRARGKIMGHLDATIDIFHSGCITGTDLQERIKQGQKISARIISTFPDAEPPKVAVSLLPQVSLLNSTEKHPLEALPIGLILEAVKVKRVEADLGLFCDVGLDDVLGFIHISRISDGKIEFLEPNTGKYKVGAQHKARVIGFNSVDNLFILSAEHSVISKPFLRINEIHVGNLVNGKVLKIIPAGLLVQLTDKITAFVPSIHMADIVLRNPEKKFKEGGKVKCRVLKTDVQKKKVILTLKKTLIHSEYPIITCYKDAKQGQKTTGVLSKLLTNGAVIEFYNGVHAFLPVAEMSEAYISDPKDHFHIGQTITVHILDVDAAEEKIKVSCRDPKSVSIGRGFCEISVGIVVSGIVESKTAEDVVVSITELEAKGIIILGHLSDRETDKCRKLQKKLRIGQVIHELVVLEKNLDKKSIYLSAKKSLITAAKENKLPKSLDECKIGDKFYGYVKSIANYGLFVGFAGNFSGLALRQVDDKTRSRANLQNLADNYVSVPASVFSQNQSVTAYIVDIDYTQSRVQLSLKPIAKNLKISKEIPSSLSILDPSIKSIDDFKPGRLTKAKILSVKETQINVELSGFIQGRIDSSVVFDTYDAIVEPKHPLKDFKVGQIMEVMVLGQHSAKYRKGLAITHKTSNVRTVFDLSIRPSDLKAKEVKPITFDSIKVGSHPCVFINNITAEGLWVNITPTIRGRIQVLDISDHVEGLQRLNKRYSIGMALQTKVTGIDEKLFIAHLSLRDKPILSHESINASNLLPGRVTKISEQGMMVQLSESIIGRVFLTDMSDDFSSGAQFKNGQIARFCVLDVDQANRKIALSARASRVLSSSSKVVDLEILSMDDLKIGQVVRGFIKNIADKGLFISLSRNVTARVKISEISDDYIKDWKKLFKPMQLIQGKIINLDSNSKQVEMSLKNSAMGTDLGPRLGFTEYKIGQIVDGTVRKVEEFGVFIHINGSANVSGLCHRSEISENKVTDAKELFSEGDLVKAKILKIDVENRKISFGLKPSYFMTEDVEMEVDVQPVDFNSDEEFDIENEFDDKEKSPNSMIEPIGRNDQAVEPLALEGFDWNGETMDDLMAQPEQISESENDGSTEARRKKKRKKTTIPIDRTADLSTKTPESAADYERLILGSPNSSYLWVNYMAFLLQFSDIEKAREIGHRALKTIHFREEEEKMNVWIAFLNLENAFGTENTLEETFKKACQEALKFEKADQCWNVMIKKFRTSCKVWLGYAQFLIDHADVDAARELLPRSKKSLPERKYIKITKRFAQLEFRSGDPERGRTIFEGLLSDHPKRLDLWNVLIDLETKQDNKDGVRRLFQRVLSLSLSSKNAKSLFKKWLAFEKRHGDERTVEDVKRRAIEYVETLGT